MAAASRASGDRALLVGQLLDEAEQLVRDMAEDQESLDAPALAVAWPGFLTEARDSYQALSPPPQLGSDPLLRIWPRGHVVPGIRTRPEPLLAAAGELLGQVADLMRSPAEPRAVQGQPVDLDTARRRVARIIQLGAHLTRMRLAQYAHGSVSAGPGTGALTRVTAGRAATRAAGVENAATTVLRSSDQRGPQSPRRHG